MPEAQEPDVVRLTVPPDADLEPVLEVAVAVLGRRVRLADDAIQAARVAVGDAFAEITDGDGHAPVEMEVEVHLATDQLVVRLRAGAVERAIELPVQVDSGR
jgi:hypothetical protein